MDASAKTIHGFFKWTTAKLGTEHKEQNYSDKNLKERERENVSWVMVHSDLIMKCNNIFSNLIWYHYHGIEASGLNDRPWV